MRKFMQNIMEIPAELALTINESIEMINWDDLAPTARFVSFFAFSFIGSNVQSIPLAIVLNGLFVTARLRSITAPPEDLNDVWDESNFMGMASSDLDRLARWTMTTLVMLSVANMIYVFTRTRKYQLRQPEAIRTWKLGHKSKELFVWDPPRFALYVFCLFSPLGLFIIQGAEDWMYSTGLAFLLACTLYTIASTFLKMSKHHLLISSQVMKEYDDVFVQPRLFPPRRSFAVQVGGGTRRSNLLEDVNAPQPFFRTPLTHTVKPGPSPRVYDIR
jgi:hypothetical protein